MKKQTKDDKMEDSKSAAFVMLCLMIAAFIAVPFTSWWVVVVIGAMQLLPLGILTLFNFIIDRKRNPLTKALEQIGKVLSYV